MKLHKTYFKYLTQRKLDAIIYLSRQRIATKVADEAKGYYTSLERINFIDSNFASLEFKKRNIKLCV